MEEQTEEERGSGMSKNIIDGLKYAYEAYCRGDIEGAVDAIDVDPDILWIEPNEFYAGGTYRGREAVIDYLTLAYSTTEQVQNVPEEILVVGDKIAVFLHFRAWPKGGVQRFTVVDNSDISVRFSVLERVELTAHRVGAALLTHTTPALDPRRRTRPGEGGSHEETDPCSRVATATGQVGGRPRQQEVASARRGNAAGSVRSPP